MTNNVLGIVVSFAFIAVIMALSTVLQKLKIIGDEGARKFIHIGVSNWWLIYVIYFDNIWFACVVPAIFIALNYASYKLDLVKAMERDPEEKSLGTVYYPMSLLILVIASTLLHMPYLGALGIFIMGYGDGLAGLIGKKFGRQKLYQKKSVIGTATMFTVSLIVSYLILSIYTPDISVIGSLLIASVVTFIELLTSSGLDNITVPLGSSAIYYLLITFGSQQITTDLVIGILLSVLIAVAAYSRKSLDRSGAIAAIIVGSAIYAFAGLAAWIALILFFVSSSVITQYKKAKKAKLSIEYKNSSRNYKQVLASGLIPAVLSVAYFVTKSEAVLLAVIAAIAVSCSDTWGSEIGVLNKGKNVSITTFKPVPKGESGGVSLLGTNASLAGAFMIAVFFVASQLATSSPSLMHGLQILALITLLGFAGSIIDSLLGAKFQVKYIDSKTKSITESEQTNGKLNKQASGVKFINNDMVNLLSSVVAGAIALVVFVVTIQ